MADSSSCLSSLTSVFHDLLGEGAAKEVAADWQLQQVIVVGQQSRESNKDEGRLFSKMFIRRVGLDEAERALAEYGRKHQMANAQLQVLRDQLASAMLTLPIWHCVVDSLDKPKMLGVSIFFMQNMDELTELARDCLIEFLTEDNPDELQEGIRNPQFQMWAKQWYLQSMDLSDERSIRYICRLGRCNVLFHCIRNGFHACCRLLLDEYSDLTAKERWLVLAEPLRLLPKFQANSIHEAAYCGSARCLRVLVEYAKRHNLDWKDLKDSTDRTALALAEDQRKRGKEGAVECCHLLRLEYGESATDLGTLDSSFAFEGILIIDVENPTMEKRRYKYPLPAECSWAHLTATCGKAMQEVWQHGEMGRIAVLLVSQHIYGANADAIHAFFRCCRNAWSLGFSKCRFMETQASLLVLDAVKELLADSNMPKWERLYVFQPMSCVKEEKGDRVLLEEQMKCDSQSFIQKVNGLCNLIASKPHLPLWRCDRLHSSWYMDYDPGLGACFQAALDVKSCVRLLQSPAEKPIYRSFWPRLLAVDRRWLNRLRMLSDASLTDPWQAVDPCARPCLVRCAQLWLWALCPQGDPSFWVHSRLLQRQQLEELCSEVDSGLVGLLMMSKLMPGLEQDLHNILPPLARSWLPATARVLSAADAAAAAQGEVKPVKLVEGKGKSKGKGKRKL